MSIPSQTKTFFSILLLVALVAIVPKILTAEAGSQSRSRIGAFYFQENIDEFTDEDRSLIYSYDENDDKSLDWRCMEDGLNVVVDLDQHYAGDEDEDILVRYRFDDKPATEHEYWRLLNDKESAYIRMNQVEAFTKAALASGEVLMEAVDPADDETLSFRIPLNGLREALSRFPSGDETEGKKGYAMAQKVMIKHPASGLMKTGFYGFSWTYLFFGWFVPLFRGELGVAVLHLFFTMFTAGIWQFIVAFLYNNQYMTRMLSEKGYVLADSESIMLAARQKLGIAAPV